MALLVPTTVNHPGAMCWRRSFPGRADQVKAVRQFVGFLMSGSPKADDVVLAADELVSNAIRHSRSGAPGGLMVVEVRRWHGNGASIAVTDQGGIGEPRCRSIIEADELDEGGRGLATVAAVSSSWGCHGNTSGRTVTAVFA